MKKASAVPAQSRAFGPVRVSVTDQAVVLVTPFDATDAELDDAETFVHSIPGCDDPIDQFHSDTDDGHLDAWIRVYIRSGVTSGDE